MVDPLVGVRKIAGIFECLVRPVIAPTHSARAASTGSWGSKTRRVNGKTVARLCGAYRANLLRAQRRGSYLAAANVLYVCSKFPNG